MVDKVDTKDFCQNGDFHGCRLLSDSGGGDGLPGTELTMCEVGRSASGFGTFGILVIVEHFKGFCVIPAIFGGMYFYSVKS